MLGKLMKYEIMATARIFLPLFGLILLLAAFNRVLFPLNSNTFDVPRMITMTVYIFLMVALCVMTLVVTIQRFSRNLLGDEGYLSFTLPVKTYYHIVSKAVVALMWTALSLIVSFFSIFLLAVNDRQSMRDFSEGCMELGEAFSRYGGWAWLILAEVVVLLVVATLMGILELYAAISVGHLSSKHKLLAGFGTFIGFGIIGQIVLSFFANSSNTDSLFWSYIGPNFTLSGLSALLLFAIGVTAVFGAAFFFLTNWILKRKLNLE